MVVCVHRYLETIDETRTVVKFYYEISDTSPTPTMAFRGVDSIYTGRKPDVEVTGVGNDMFPVVNSMIDTYEVTPEQAELITGMHYPAAMDRLMELVAEHHQPAYPKENP